MAAPVVVYIAHVSMSFTVAAIPTIRNLRISESTNSSITLSWDFPTYSNEPIEGFEVSHYYFNLFSILTLLSRSHI